MAKKNITTDNIAARAVNSTLGVPVNVKHFGATGDGVTDDTVAIQSALNVGGDIRIPEGTYIVNKLSIITDTRIVGSGYNKSILKRKAGADLNSDLLAMTVDSHLEISGVRFNGGKDVNPTYASGNLQGGIIISKGSGVVENCYFENFSHHAVQTGGEDRYFTTNTTFAHDINIINNIFNLGTVGEVGDAIRPTRTHSMVISGNKIYGGYSGIRCNYYCQDILISNNLCDSSTLDVGITAGLGSDFTICNNICKNSIGQHGLEIAGTKRVTMYGNIAKNNNYDGIRINAYTPPAGANYEGYVDGIFVSATEQYPEDCIITNNILEDNGVFGLRDVRSKNTLIAENNIRGNGQNAIYTSGSAGTQNNIIKGNNLINGQIEFSEYQFNLIVKDNFIKEIGVGNLPAFGNIRNLKYRVEDPESWVVKNGGDYVYDSGNSVYKISNTELGSAYNNELHVYGVKGFFIYETEFRSDINESTFEFVIQLYNAGVFVASIEVTLNQVLSDLYTKKTGFFNTQTYAGDTEFDYISFRYKALSGQTNNVFVKYLNIY